MGEGGTERTLFLLSCIGWGLQGCGRRRPHGGLLPRLSILTAASAAVYFCCTVLEVAFTGCYPAPCSVMLGLSSWRTVSRAPATVRLTCGFYYSIIYPYLSNYHTAVIKRRSGDGSRAVKAFLVCIIGPLLRPAVWSSPAAFIRERRADLHSGLAAGFCVGPYLLRSLHAVFSSG